MYGLGCTTATHVGGARRANASEKVEQPLPVGLAEGGGQVVRHRPHAGVHQAHVPAGAAEADLRPFQHGDGGAAPGQVQDGGEAGEAGADDRDLGFGVAPQRRGRGRRRGGALPKAVAARIALHAAAFPARFGELDHTSPSRR